MTDKKDGVTTEILSTASWIYQIAVVYPNQYMRNSSSQTGDIHSRKKSPSVPFSDSFQAIPALKKPLSFAEIRRIAREEHAQEAMYPRK